MRSAQNFQFSTFHFQPVLNSEFHMSSLHSILIISWDTVTRSESLPFAWAEKLTQAYKELEPELFIDYIDLHQDILPDPFDAEFITRCNQAKVVCVIINDDKTIFPNEIALALRRVEDFFQIKSTFKQYLFTKKSQSVLTNWLSINSNQILAKELATLKR